MKKSIAMIGASESGSDTNNSCARKAASGLCRVATWIFQERPIDSTSSEALGFWPETVSSTILF